MKIRWYQHNWHGICPRTSPINRTESEEARATTQASKSKNEADFNILDAHLKQFGAERTPTRWDRQVTNWPQLSRNCPKRFCFATHERFYELKA